MTPFSAIVRLAMEDEPRTEELKALQLEREATEDQLARTAPDESEAAQHERRSEKARYLKEKLEERAMSEREAEQAEGGGAEGQEPGEPGAE
jgi:hypothetical protein